MWISYCFSTFFQFLLSTSAFGPGHTYLVKHEGWVGNAPVWDPCRRGRCQLWQVGWAGNSPESEDQGMEAEKPPEVTCVCQQDRAERGWPRVTGGHSWAGLPPASSAQGQCMCLCVVWCHIHAFRGGMSLLKCFYHGAPFTACEILSWILIQCPFNEICVCL